MSETHFGLTALHLVNCSYWNIFVSLNMGSKGVGKRVRGAHPLTKSLEENPRVCRLSVPQHPLVLTLPCVFLPMGFPFHHKPVLAKIRVSDGKMQEHENGTGSGRTQRGDRQLQMSQAEKVSWALNSHDIVLGLKRCLEQNESAASLITTLYTAPWRDF